MNQNSNQDSNGNGATPSAVNLGTKLAYIGTGVLIGLIIYPFVRKTLAKVQPSVDSLFDDLTGKAEDLAEKASDFVAKARARVLSDQPDAGHEGHNH